MKMTTDGGVDVRTASIAELIVMKSRAWDTSNMYDLKVIDIELKRRGLPGVW